MDNEIPLETLLSKGKITRQTYEKTTLARTYIEQKYNLKNSKAFELQTLLTKVDSLNIPITQKDKLTKRVYDLYLNNTRKTRQKQTILDYDSISIIGRGAFGEVHICRHKKTNEIVAIKKIKKDNVIEKNQAIHTRNEQIFLSKVKSPWIVDLKASFQEGDYLYLVMEYLPGGDFMNLLIDKDIIPEDEAVFYFAEMVLAIEVIHNVDCIHRDIKPDNILIDKNGHLKLSDFGLAKIPELFTGDKEKDKDKETNANANDNGNGINSNKRNRRNYSCVGTAYYVAPEVLEKKGYGKDIDWWSAGAILYEMLIGYAPFYSKDTSESCNKILNWQRYLQFPSNKPISSQAKDLIVNLLTLSANRLGKNGANEIKAHPFFKCFDWDNIAKAKAPFIPKLKNDYDNTYFESFQPLEPFHPISSSSTKSRRKDFEFLGYTYKESDDDMRKLSFVDILNETIEIPRIIPLEANTIDYDNGNNKDKAMDKDKKKKGIEISKNDSCEHLSKTIESFAGGPNDKLRIIPLPNKIKIDCSIKKTINLSDKRVNGQFNSKYFRVSPSPPKLTIVNKDNGRNKNKPMQPFNKMNTMLTTINLMLKTNTNTSKDKDLVNKSRLSNGSKTQRKSPEIKKNTYMNIIDTFTNSLVKKPQLTNLSKK